MNLEDHLLIQSRNDGGRIASSYLPEKTKPTITEKFTESVKNPRLKSGGCQGFLSTSKIPCSFSRAKTERVKIRNFLSIKKHQSNVSSEIQRRGRGPDKQKRKAYVDRRTQLYGKKRAIRRMAHLKLPAYRIAHALQINRQFVREYLVEVGLYQDGRSLRGIMDEEDLRRYVSEGMPCTEIGKSLEVTRQAVSDRIMRHGIHSIFAQARQDVRAARKTRDYLLQEEIDLTPSLYEKIDAYALRVIREGLHRQGRDHKPRYDLVGDIALVLFVYDLESEKGQLPYGALISHKVGVHRNFVYHICEKAHLPLRNAQYIFLSGNGKHKSRDMQ